MLDFFIIIAIQLSIAKGMFVFISQIPRSVPQFRKYTLIDISFLNAVLPAATQHIQQVGQVVSSSTQNSQMMPLRRTMLLIHQYARAKKRVAVAVLEHCVYTLQTSLFTQ